MYNIKYMVFILANGHPAPRYSNELTIKKRHIDHPIVYHVTKEVFATLKTKVIAAENSALLQINYNLRYIFFVIFHSFTIFL